MHELATLNTRIKSYLKYSDDETEDLKQYINTGIARLEGLTGTTLDFVNNVFAYELLINYVRYAVNNALEYFEANFQGELLRLQLLEGVKANELKG